jgi:hypothetical protein
MRSVTPEAMREDRCRGNVAKLHYPVGKNKTLLLTASPKDRPGMRKVCVEILTIRNTFSSIWQQVIAASICRAACYIPFLALRFVIVLVLHE